MSPDDFIQRANAGQIRTWVDPRDTAQTATKSSAKKPRNALLSLLPAITGIIGGVGGSFLAPGAGTVAGGVGGSALGEWLAQKINGEDTNIGAIAGEGALGALGGVGNAFKAARGVGAAVKGAEAVADASKATKAATGVRAFIGNKLTGAANDTALRAAQVGGKKEALKNFQKRYDQDLGEYLRTNNVIGKGSKEIESSVVNPLNQKYGDLVTGINRPITSSDVIANNQETIKKLIGSSSTANSKLATDVQEELKQIFAKNGGSIDPSKFNAIKSEYQANARNSYKLGANAKPGVDEQVAKILKKTLQGVSGSDELAKTGRGIDQGYKAADIIASAEQNGRGNLGIGLTDLLAGGGGAVLGGVPGIVAGVAAKRAINSPKTQAFIANKLAGAGERVLNGAPSKAGAVAADLTKKGTAVDYAKTQVPVRALQGVASSMMPADAGATDGTGETFNPETQQDVAAIMAEHGGDGGGATGDVSDPQAQYTRANLMSDLQRDPKNSKYYLDLFKSLQELDASTAKPLNATQLTQANNANSALSDLATLRSAVSKDGGVLLKDSLPGGAIVRGLTGTTDFDAAKQNIVDVIARLRSGAAITNDEAQRYMGLLPKFGDSQDSAAKKLDRLETLLYGFANPQAASPDLASILSAQ